MNKVFTIVKAFVAWVLVFVVFFVIGVPMVVLGVTVALIANSFKAGWESREKFLDWVSSDSFGD